MLRSGDPAVGDKLQALLELRQRELDEAEGRLARAREAADQQTGARAVARQALEEAVAARESRSALERERSGSFRGGDWQNERRYQQRLDKGVQQCAAALRVEDLRLSEAERVVDDARGGVVSARQALEAVQKHQERAEQRGATKQQRREEQEVDDLVAAQATRKRTP